MSVKDRIQKISQESDTFFAGHALLDSEILLNGHYHYNVQLKYNSSLVPMIKVAAQDTKLVYPINLVAVTLQKYNGQFVIINQDSNASSGVANFNVPNSLNSPSPNGAVGSILSDDEIKAIYDRERYVETQLSNAAAKLTFEIEKIVDPAGELRTTINNKIDAVQAFVNGVAVDTAQLKVVTDPGGPLRNAVTAEIAASKAATDLSNGVLDGKLVTLNSDLNAAKLRLTNSESSIVTINNPAGPLRQEIITKIAAVKADIEAQGSILDSRFNTNIAAQVATAKTDMNTLMDTKDISLKTAIESTAGTLTTRIDSKVADAKTIIESATGVLITAMNTKDSSLKTAIESGTGPLATLMDTKNTAIKNAIESSTGVLATLSDTKDAALKTAIEATGGTLTSRINAASTALQTQVDPIKTRTDQLYLDVNTTSTGIKDKLNTAVSNITTLSTDKASVSSVNTLSSTVGTQGSRISTTETILTNNGVTTSSNIAGRVSTIETGISGANGINAKITTLETTKANQTALTAEALRITNLDASVTSSLNNLTLNSKFQDGLKGWTTDVINGSNPGVIAGATVVSGVFKTSTPSAWIFGPLVQVNTARTYRVRFKVRTLVDGTDTAKQLVFAGVSTHDKNKTVQYGGAGSHRYFAISSRKLVAADGWQTYEGTITGEGDASNQFRVDTVYVRPMFIVNYSLGNADMEVQYLEFEDVTDLVQTSARITAVELASTTADTALASRATLIETNLTNTTTTINNRITGVETAKADLSALTASNSRISAIETDINTGTGSIKSRLGTVESTIISNNTASATRLTNLESGVTTLTGQLTTTNASVSTEATTRANADTAQTSRIGNLESTVNTAGTGLVAKVQDLVTTKADITTLTAATNRVSSLETGAKLANKIFDGTMNKGLDSWSYSFEGEYPAIPTSLANTKLVDVPGIGRVMELKNDVSVYSVSLVPINPTRQYKYTIRYRYISIEPTLADATQVIYGSIVNLDSSYISINSNPPGGTYTYPTRRIKSAVTVNTWYEDSGIVTDTIPSYSNNKFRPDVAYARLGVLVRGANNNNVVQIQYIKFEDITDVQESNSRILTVENTLNTPTTGLVSKLDSLSTTVTNNNTTLSGQITNLTTSKADLSALTTSNTRISTLESDLNTATSGVKARLTTVESTVISNNSASVTRLNNLEATVNTGTNSVSSLRTAITDEATARTNADTTAGNKITALESSVNGGTGLLARVTTVESTKASKVDLAAEATRITNLTTSTGNAQAASDGKITNLESIVSNPTSGLVTKLSNLDTQTNTNLLNLTTNYNFNNGLFGWSSDIYGANQGVIAGASVVEGVYKSSASAKYVFGPMIPVDTSRTYRVNFKVRVTTDGTDLTKQTVHAGISTFNKDKVATFGGAGTHRYCAVSAVQVTAAQGWRVFQGTITGEGDASNQFRASTVFVRPMFITNTTGGTAAMEVAYCQIEDITDLVATNAAITTLSQTSSAADTAFASQLTNLTASTSTAQGASNTKIANLETVVSGVGTGLVTKVGALESSVINNNTTVIGKITNLENIVTNGTTGLVTKVSTLEAITQPTYITITEDPISKNDLTGWGPSYTSGTNNGTVTGASIIDGVLKTSSSSLWVSGPLITIDTRMTYKVKIKLRVVVDGAVPAEQRFYSGMSMFNSSKVFADGGALGPGRRYCTASSITLSAAQGWMTYEGSITGTGIAANTFRADAAYARPLFLLNYVTGTAQMEVESFTVTATADFVSTNAKINELAQIATTADSAIITQLNTLTTNTTNASTTTNARIGTLEISSTNADTALAGRLTTLESSVNTGPDKLSALRASITSEASTRASTDTTQASQISTLETSVNSGANSLTALRGSLTNLETVKADASALTLEANKITVLQGQVTTLNGTTAGSVKDSINVELNKTGGVTSRLNSIDSINLSRSVVTDNYNFIRGLEGWTRQGYAGDLTNAALAAGDRLSIVDDPEGKVLRASNYDIISRKEYYPLQPGKTLNIKARLRVNPAAGSNAAYYIGLMMLNSSLGFNYSTWSPVYISYGNRTTDSGWFDVDVNMTTDSMLATQAGTGAKYYRPFMLLSHQYATGVPLTGDTYVKYLSITDVTDLVTTNARVSTLEYATTNAAGSVATSLNSLRAEIKGTGTPTYATINSLSSVSVTTKGVAEAIRGVELDVNGRVSGYKNINNGTSASFSVTADKFLIYTPTTGDTPVFAVGTVNGATKLALRGDMIVDGSITANKLTIGSGINLIPNGDFVAEPPYPIAGFSNVNSFFRSYLFNNATVSLSSDFAPYGKRAVRFDDASATSSNVDKVTIFSKPIPVTPGKYYSFSALTKSYRADPTGILIRWTDGADTPASGYYGGTTVGTSSGTAVGTKVLQTAMGALTYEQMHVSAVAPAAARYARIYVSKGYRQANETSSVLFITDMMFTESSSPITEVPNYSAGGYTVIDGGMIQTGFLSADRIAANSIDAGKITANSITAREIASNVITADLIKAGAITTDKLAIGGGKNLINNSEFPNKILTGWSAIAIALGPPLVSVPITSLLALNPSDTFAQYTDGGYGTATYSNRTDLNRIETYTDLINVRASQRYIFSASVSAHRCNPTLQIMWYTDTTYISETSAVILTTNQSTTNKLFTTGIAPTNATKARAYIRGYVVAGDINPYIFMSKPMLEQVVSTQLTPSLYSPSSSTLIDAGTIVTGVIQSNVLEAGLVRAKLIEAPTINAVDIIATGSIRTDQLAANSVVAGNILAGSIGSDKIPVNTINAGHVQSNTIEARMIQANAITADKLAVGNGINMVFNPMFLLGEKGWYSGGLGTHGVTTSTSYTVTGSPAMQLKPADGKVGDIGRFVDSEAISISGGTYYMTSAYVSSHRIGSELLVMYFDTDSQFISAYGIKGPNPNTSGNTTASQTRIYMNALSPSNAAYMVIRLGSRNTNTPECTLVDSYIWWSKVMVEQTSISANSPSVFSNSGSTLIDGGAIVTGYINSNIIEANSITAAHINTSSVKVSMFGADGLIRETDIGPGQISTNLIKADAITSDVIKAGAITVDKLSVGKGSNLMPNSNFFGGFNDGWKWMNGSTSLGGLPGFETAITTLAGDPEYNFGSNVLRIIIPSGSADGAMWVNSPKVYIQGNKHYIFQAKVASHRALTKIVVYMYDSNNTQVATATMTDTVAIGGPVKSNWANPFVKLLAPGNASYAVMRLVSGLTTPGYNPYIWATEFMVEEGTATTTEASAYSQDGSTLIDGSLIRTRTINADSIIAETLQVKNVNISEAIAANKLSIVDTSTGKVKGVHIDKDGIFATGSVISGNGFFVLKKNSTATTGENSQPLTGDTDPRIVFGVNTAGDGVFQGNVNASNFIGNNSILRGSSQAEKFNFRRATDQNLSTSELALRTNSISYGDDYELSSTYANNATITAGHTVPYLEGTIEVTNTTLKKQFINGVVSFSFATSGGAGVGAYLFNIFISDANTTIATYHTVNAGVNLLQTVNIPVSGYVNRAPSYSIGTPTRQLSIKVSLATVQYNSPEILARTSLSKKISFSVLQVD